MTQIKRWWSDKYKLPPNHQLFERQSVAEVTQDMYEDLLFQREDLVAALEHSSGSETENLMTRLNAVNKVLGYEQHHQDDLFDEWERELAEGRVPDLNAKPRS